MVGRHAVGWLVLFFAVMKLSQLVQGISPLEQRRGEVLATGMPMPWFLHPSAVLVSSKP